MQPSTDSSRSDLERWKGPSYALAVSDGNTAMCVLGGYRKELAVWEGRLPTIGQRHLAWRASEAVAFGSTSLIGKDAMDWTSFELEVILDDMPHSHLLEILQYCAGPIISENIQDLPEIGSVPISANQDLRIPQSWIEAGVSAVDLRISTIPTRRRKRGAEVIYGSRWLRLIVMPRGFIALWYPIEGSWSFERVRWPHYCIPSRSPSWIEIYSIQPDMDGSRRLYEFLQDFVIHEEYFLNSWGLELELWEESLYGQLVDIDSEIFGRLRFPELQRELGHLADYVTNVRFDQRNLTRRSDESRALSGSQVNQLVKRHSESLNNKIEQSRALLRHAFTLLSNSATGEQFYVARKQQQVSERIQSTITFVTAILLVPTLIAGVYGSNIHELSPSSRGTLPNLLGAMTIGAVVSAAVLRWRQDFPLVGRTNQANTIILAAGLAVVVGMILVLEIRGYSVSVLELVIGGLLVIGYSAVRAALQRTRRKEDGK
jgi:hypothetical protein